MSDIPNDDRDAYGAITAVAHELRTPLTAIQGAVEILRDETAGPLNAAQREFVNLAHRNLARLKDRIEDALDIAGRQRGAQVETAPVGLEELAGCVAKRVAVELGTELPLRFEGFSGELPLAMEATSLCRTLASIVATVGRHLGKSSCLLVQAGVEQNRIRFEVAADGRQAKGLEHSVIHDASLALACKMVEIHGGTLSELKTGFCGAYVLLPLRPISTHEGPG